MALKPHEIVVKLKDVRSYPAALEIARQAGINFFGEEKEHFFDYRAAVEEFDVGGRDNVKIYKGTITVFYDEDKENKEE